MDLSVKFCVIVLLVLVTTGVFLNMGLVQVALARDCEAPSHKFHGACVRDSNCASVCETEGFSGDKREGPLMRCYCTKQC
ncbi:hypothetical protein BRADI_1g56893v3 [Brachypodium distachyon]|uniref:Knottins-like domain-containing protein n=1 Tax=Brachypodium distachyon TaxID=15368 RepID=A0A0Q3JT41_BRADI|nr:hypothetical protein BRADI_1g56893v3 [Brachypodium distachyon]